MFVAVSSVALLLTVAGVLGLTLFAHEINAESLGLDKIMVKDFAKTYSQPVPAGAETMNLKGEQSLEAMLEEYKIDWTFLAKDVAANKLLAHLPGWRRAYGDDQATIFVRER